MNAEAGQGGDPVADALLALSLFLSAPDVLGGLSLRGAGPARDALFELLCNTGVAVRRLPAHVDDERLLGGVDLAASLATGRWQSGSIAMSRGGWRRRSMEMQSSVWCCSTTGVTRMTKRRRRR